MFILIFCRACLCLEIRQYFAFWSLFFAEIMRVGTLHYCRQLLWAPSTLKILAPLIFSSFFLESNAAFPWVQKDGQLLNRKGFCLVHSMVLKYPLLKDIHATSESSLRCWELHHTGSLILFELRHLHLYGKYPSRD